MLTQNYLHVSIVYNSGCQSGYYSIHLQGICTSKLLFTHVLTGWPGSVHDSRVFRNCSVMENHETKFPPGYHLVGDSAYPLLPSVMTPFTQNGDLDRYQRRFNRELSKQRNVIERAFGHLKGRFLRLQFFRTENVRFLCKVILASCTLHNIGILNDDQLMEEFYDDDDDDREAVQYPYHDNITGQQRRNDIMADLN